MANAFELEIDSQFMKYSDWVDGYASQIFEDIVKPWLEKYHLRFVAGMGDYFIAGTDRTPRWFMSKHKDQWIYNTDGKLDKDKLPQYLIEVLESSISGMDGNCLGSLMPEFDPREEKAPCEGG